MKIKVKDTGLYVRTEIDSSGMDAFAVNDPNLGDNFSKEEAERFLKRLKERFPESEFEVVE